MAIDPVSIVFEAIGAALELYDKLSEVDRQKVKDGLGQERAQLAASRSDLQKTVDQVKAERDEVVALLQQTHEAIQPIAAHPDTPSPIADVLNSMASQIRDRFAAPLPAPVAMIGDKPL